MSTNAIVAKDDDVVALAEMHLMEAVGGLGVSTDARDNTVPMIYLLQKTSPQVDPADPAYEPAARPGMIWVRGYSEPFISGDEGIIVQPCWFWKEFKEWIPRSRGGGMAGLREYRIAGERDAARRPSAIDFGDQRGLMPPAGKITPGEEIPDADDAVFTQNPKNKQLVWARNNGGALNELVFVRSHAVRLFVAPDVALNYVIPMKSTGLQVSRDWMTMFNARRVNGQPTNSFAFQYRLTTKQRSKSGNTWYVLHPQWVVGPGPQGTVALADLRAGRLLHDAFKGGAKTVEEDILVEEGGRAAAAVDVQASEPTYDDLDPPF